MPRRDSATSAHCISRAESLENLSNNRCDAVHAQLLKRQNIRKTSVFFAFLTPGRDDEI